jgi:hypothetical protein
MATRLIVDSSFSDTITYYSMFPKEPKEAAGAEMSVTLPIDAADKLNPMTLLGILDRILAMPGSEKELLIVSHGNTEGLAVPLVAGSSAKAGQSQLHILRVLGEAQAKIAAIKNLPVAQQPDAWANFLKTLQFIDGTDMVPVPKPDDLRDPKTKAKDADPKAVAADLKAVADAYEGLFQFLLDGLAGKKGTIPAKAAPFIANFQISALGGVNRSQLDQLIAKGNQVRGRLERIDVRACNLGRNKKAMEVVRLFFGCKKLCCPDVVSFEIVMQVKVDANFDTNFASNETTTTRGAIAGRQPVTLDSNDAETPVQFSAIPKSRRFDAAKTRPGDEVFMRLWCVQVRPHRFFGWLRVIDQKYVDGFVQDKVNPDVSRFTNKTALPLVGLWLVDDHNVLFPAANTTISPGPSNGDPLAGLDLGAPAATPLPAFALPRDPEYRQHLVVVP